MAIIQKNNKIPKAVVKKKVVQNNHIDRKKVLLKDNFIKVDLTKHEGAKFSPEYFTYFKNNGEEAKFSGVIIKDVDGSYIGKQVVSHKVDIEYHPKVESVKHSPEHFTYMNSDGKEKRFVGEPEFDLENNTYVGVVTETALHDEIIEIFEEK